MSSPLAIAAVTAVLKSFLENGVGHLAGMLNGVPTVSAQPPDRIKSDAAQTNRINLFLFQATENPGWRNRGLPSRGTNGERLSNPPLALNLHYLLTAYGSGDFHAEVLLGHAMFVLHEMPVLTRDAIRAAMPVGLTVALLNGLTAAKLAEQIEQIKITPQPMSVEEISKIWSALHTQYRPTAVYQVSVVLIESERSVPPTLPVRARNFAVVPFQQPAIDLIQSQSADSAPIVADQPILAGYNLVIEGRRLRGETTQVWIDGSKVVLDATRVSASRIVVALPPTLYPGLHSVQVVHLTRFGDTTPPLLRHGVESNVAAFVLVPNITNVTPIPVQRGSTVSLTINPPVGRDQRVALLAGRGTVSIPARPAVGPPETNTLAFPIPDDFPTGLDLLLRVQIDGAESPLGVDAEGKFASPTIKITT